MDKWAIAHIFASHNNIIITATDSTHGAVEGDFVTISGAVSLGGLITAAVLNQEYQIVSVPDVNTYTITAKECGNCPEENRIDNWILAPKIPSGYSVDFIYIRK